MILEPKKTKAHAGIKHVTVSKPIIEYWTPINIAIIIIIGIMNFIIRFVLLDA